MWSPVRQEGPTKVIGPAYTVKYVKINDSMYVQPLGLIASPLGATQRHYVS